ncbi:hypothetical protein BOQ62_06780 [Chryseobacterium sp. CH21]|nr:hypothetical protein BOQ62_06780 [Chryseobacterium sp. CH21]
MKLYSQGATRNQWLTSKTPNYATNINLAYPYSEQEYSAGNVNLIPEPSSFIDLIDFYGEGRIVVNAMVSGFKSAYNINHEHQRVSNGPDKDRKIPNRIPVKSYNGDLYLSKYVANDKVSTITLMGAPIQKNTAEEMARMIRKDGFGKIIIYGFSSSDAAVTTLETELEKIGFYYVPKYKLTAPFNEITGFSSAPRVYKSKKIKVVGEKVFYSLNPKADLGTVQSDMVTLDYSSLLALNSDLSGGIKGTIDKPGGKITVEVYAHDNNEADGIQKLIHFGSSGTPKIVYSAYSDINSVNQYVEKTIQLPYGFGINSDGSFKVLGEAKSNNIKQLGANTKNGWRVSDCDWAPVRFFIGLAGK